MKNLFSPKVYILIVSALALLCVGLIGLVLFIATNIGFETGDYSVEEVIVSSNLEDTQPTVDGVVFQPSDTIFCTVRTKGVDGIIGMRWFFGNEIISEGFARTTNNSISSYITKSSPDGLPEGIYHVEVLIVEDQPIETIYFEIKNQSSP